jgi:hypothetical protein
MRSAALIGALHQRSASQQVEYWASLGRSVAGLLDPEQLLSVTAGVARLRLEPVRVAAVDQGSVFDIMEQARRNGSLAGSVTTARDRNQASVGLPPRIAGADQQRWHPQQASCTLNQAPAGSDGYRRCR